MKNGFLKSSALYAPAFALCLLAFTAQAEEPQKSVEPPSTEAAVETPGNSTVTAEKQPSEEYVRLAWAASSKSNWDELAKVTDQCLEFYGEEAKKLHAELTAFPTRDRIDHYKVLNDVGTCLFVKAEGLMHQGKNDEAIALFTTLSTDYRFAQSWDPSRGAYWSIAEKSQDSIKVMKGEAHQEEEMAEPVKKTLPFIANPGTDAVVDYSKYGEFVGEGTSEYRYKVKDMKGLTAAVGEGIYPNTGDIFKNPNYKQALKEGRLEGNHWDFVNSDDLEAAYFKWTQAPEPWGVKLFYLGMIFEKAKMYDRAIKNYQALIVHFPDTVAWTYWQTPWYPGQAAISKIKHLLREHPEIGLKFTGAKIQIKEGFDNTEKNDVTITWSGRLLKKTWMDLIRERLNLPAETVKLEGIKRELGKGQVRLVQYSNGHWQLLVDNKPYAIHGITYAPTKIGQSPDKGTLTNWMYDDFNKNGRIDGPYDAWVDQNRNNKQDSDEPVQGDFQLMKEMGVNTLRIYHHPADINKDLLRKMHREFGFRVIMGDFLGKYTIGSGAGWMEGTDYENPEHQKNMMESVRKMVLEHKDEPYLLFWLLGNENNYGVASNADKKPEAYYKFVNEVAKMIKELDPNHPVAICNGDTLFLDVFAKNAPDVDIYAANVYRGEYGFGSFWQQVQDASDRPAFITEYGAPAYVKHVSQEAAEEAQARYHRGNWLDIKENMAGYPGSGNALGGVAFEWLDEWWKNYEPAIHDKKSDVIGPFPGGYYYEEWFGLLSQGNGKNSPYLRQPRKVYYTYKALWN